MLQPEGVVEVELARRTPVFAANWKMNTTLREGVELCRAVRAGLDRERAAQVVVCPPFTHLATLRDCLEGSTLELGAQDVYFEAKGAYTGEISPPMLHGLVQYVIIGHSERRAYFHETDEDVNRKVRAALGAGLVPIMCIGETGAQRQANETEAVLERQIEEGLRDIDLGSGGLILAYEPVWAIGTGVSADGRQAQDAIAFVRARLSRLAGSAAEAIRILYGGSVTAANIAEFMTQPDIDGGLVGGASLVADSFISLVRAGVAAAAERDARRA
jgi:triosephosphate isomerase